MKLNGSEIIAECLLEQGVDTVFGYPGGAVLNIYDALYKYSDRITHILSAHEQGAAHAADGYAELLSRPQVPAQLTLSQALQQHLWIPSPW